MSDEEHHFESKADAGASKTFPTSWNHPQEWIYCHQEPSLQGLSFFPLFFLQFFWLWFWFLSLFYRFSSFFSQIFDFFLMMNVYFSFLGKIFPVMFKTLNDYCVDLMQLWDLLGWFVLWIRIYQKGLCVWKKKLCN